MDMIKKVPVSEADQQKSYFKFYERELPGISPEKRGKVFGPAMDPAKGIPFGEKAISSNLSFREMRSASA